MGATSTFRKWSIFLSIAAVSASGLISCAGKVSVKGHTVTHADVPNWITYAVGPTRMGFRDQTMRPPLYNIWTYKATSAIGPTLVAVDGIAYLTTLDGRLDALDIATGERLGRTKLPDNIEGTCTYSDGYLYVALRFGDKTLRKYDIAKGDFVWRIDAGDIASEPLVTHDAVYVSALYNHIDRYDALTGDKVWTYKTKDQHRSSPALSENTLVVGCDDGSIYALNADSGELKWQANAAAAVFATPVLSAGKIFLGSADSMFYALDIKTGVVDWQFKTRSPIYQSASATEERVLVGGSDGQFYCFQITDGEMLWTYDARSGVSTPALILGDVVYFGTLGKKYFALDLETGQDLWQFSTRGRVRTAPVVWGDYILGASEDRFVYAFSKTMTGAAKQTKGTSP